jgi:hypothetical protein
MKIWNGILAALCVIWVGAVYFVAEPEPVWDWRVAAAFAQALLSAIAIFSAWLLQNAKRASDRRELVHDTQTALLQYAFVFEWTLGRAVIAVQKGDFAWESFQLYLPTLRWAVDAMDRLKISHMPSDKAIEELVAFQHSSRLALSVMDWAVDKKYPKMASTFLDVSWNSTFQNRTDLMNALGVSPVDVRSNPPVPRVD